MCRDWPKVELPKGYELPVSSEVPVLIFSGELDPVTPPRQGDLVAETLSNSRHLVVSGQGHNAAMSGCASQLMAEFISVPDPEALDVSCLEGLERPPFFVSFSGPRP